MNCDVGVHTGRIEVAFTDADYVKVRGLHPAKIGSRSWFIMERDGGVVLERSSVGSAPSTHIKHPGWVFLANTTETIVRCKTHSREVEHVRNGQMFIKMPPHHLWPWIKDVRSSLKRMSRTKWRWHLVQELNARVRSANMHHVDMGALPDWVAGMLTQREYAEVLSNQEI